MKKLSLIILLLIFFQITASSQTCIPCLPTGITFNTQSQIDSFQINNPGCTEIEGDVVISGNDITNLNGLNVLTAVIGSLIFDFNDALTSLTGLDNLTSIGGGLGIGNSPSLTSLTGLDNVTSIGGDLYIDDNASLVSLTGLENVTSIGGLLYFDFNSALISFTGLDNLVSIGDDLVIYENNSLISLTGLDNINASSISNLAISDNPYLATCEIQSVCDYLANPTGIIDIQNNATGCNSQQEVEDACEALSVESITFEEEVSIYPNPVTSELFISSSGAEITEVTIYNQVGQKVLHHKPVTQPIDVSMLRLGIYVIEVVCGNRKMREKLIIR
ncbi:T9SS type A sorting domain-containing protein [bacterium]|nr:T9SS type A sorting domain-containing protein [bacterium]